MSRPSPARRGPRGTGPTWHVAEDGSAAAELVIVAPVLVALGLLVLFAGQLYLIRLQIDDVARSAAEAAVTASSPAGASYAASVTAAANVIAEDLPCQHFAEKTATAAFVPGGNVTVTVTCETELPTLRLIGVRAPVTLEASASDSVEPYRAVGP